MGAARRGLLLLLVLTLTAAAAAGWLALGARRLPEPGVEVTLPAGAGAREASEVLKAAGVVRSALAFRSLAALRGEARRLQAGEYRFVGRVTPVQVLRRLVAGDVILHPVTLPEGLSLAETVTILGAAGLDIRGDLEREAQRGERVHDLDPEAPDLEGYLFPDTYRFPRRVEATVVIGRLLDRFREVAGDLQEHLGAPERGVRVWVTLASLVERETGRNDERERVAAVFANRLRIGMPLQCDPTVLYALQRAGVAQTAPLARYLDFDHPYNTYRHPGLPPGPIANPGRAALRAALRPAETDELYFVADGRGGHRFSRSLDEHNRAVRQWRQEMREETER